MRGHVHEQGLLHGFVEGDELLKGGRKRQRRVRRVRQRLFHTARSAVGACHVLRRKKGRRPFRRRGRCALDEARRGRIKDGRLQIRPDVRYVRARHVRLAQRLGRHDLSVVFLEHAFAALRQRRGIALHAPGHEGHVVRRARHEGESRKRRQRVEPPALPRQLQGPRPRVHDLAYIT